MTVVELGPKTVGDDWTVYARRKAGNTVDPSDWTDLRAHLRTADGTLLGSSDEADNAEDVLAISFLGDTEKGIPATDLEADTPVLCVHIVGDTSAVPTGNPVYLQLSAVALSLMGRQTIGTFSWVPVAQVEVNAVEAP